MTEPTTAILVGGPADGRRVVLQHRQQYLNVPQRAAARTDYRYQNVTETLAERIDVVQYRIFFGDGNTVVMCPQHMQDSEAMQRLLRGYQQEVWK